MYPQISSTDKIAQSSKGAQFEVFATFPISILFSTSFLVLMSWQEAGYFQTASAYTKSHSWKEHVFNSCKTHWFGSGVKMVMWTAWFFSFFLSNTVWVESSWCFWNHYWDQNGFAKWALLVILPADVYPVKIHEAVEIGSFLVALAVAKIILYFQTEGWLLQ